MDLRRLIFSCFLFTLSSVSLPVFAQPGFKVDVKKEKPYENRVLRAEKTGDGKLKQPKKFFQNLTTHYNYVFNANVKINEIIDRAKSRHKDDYSELLSFYNYSIDATSRDSLHLDSLVYKAQTGILMHDLRSDWTDDLYLLWGRAFLLWNKLDSASMMFQFMNYAYAEKEKDGYYIPVGSPREGETTLTISTKEGKGLLARSAERNEAFVWQVRTLTEMENYTEAGSLMNALKTDPHFPKRLHLDLEEAEAYWYYRQKRWDSAAHHLEVASDNAPGKLEKARWEYLAAQMYELAGKKELAREMFSRAIAHTPDPVMEVYGRLNLVRLNKTDNENYIDQNIAELLRMAKKDKYEEYRDVIYYMAAQMEMERGNLPAAEELLQKGSKYNNGNIAARSKAFLQLAHLSYDQKKYVRAAQFYDSIQLNNISENEISKVNERKPVASKISRNILLINRQDSLQKIAAMPEEERTEFVKRTLKQIRKQQGLKDEPVTTARQTGFPTNSPDLFGNQPKGEWYFYNQGARSQGAQQFQQVWGNRPNSDNWRRLSAVNQRSGNAPQNISDVTPTTDNQAANVLSFESLEAGLPLTPEKLKVSDDSIRQALHQLGAIYLNEAEDYPSAIEALEELRRRFPDHDKMDEVLFNLYHAYAKSGDQAKAGQMKRLLLDKYPGSRFTSILNSGIDPNAKANASPVVTRVYENIYNSFLEGRFTEALTEKQKADSTYKTNYWQPQLLYIEAVYHIKQRDDSSARKVLNILKTQGPTTPLGKKADNLLQALARREKLESELAQYQIQNFPETQAVTTTATQQELQQPVVNQPVAKTDSTLNKTVQKPADTVARKQDPPVVSAGFSFNANDQHYAVVVLNKVDPVFVGEAKNAFFRFSKEKFYNIPLDVQISELTPETRLVLIGNFANAQTAADYVQMAKRLAANEIVPWLSADKYTFTVINAANLGVLKSNPDVGTYRKFIEQHVKM